MTVFLIYDPKNFIGLSTDSKPLEKIPPGSIFYETDTGKNYVFDGTDWVEK